MSETAFPGRLFGPGCPGAGTAATAAWCADGTLVIRRSEGEPLQFIVTDPVPEAAGFNAVGIRISWHDHSGEFTFFIDSEAGRAAFLASAPADRAAQLRAVAGAKRRVERGFRIGAVVAALCMALVVAGAGILLFRSDTVAGWVVDRIPLQEEARLGDLVLAQVRLQTKIADTGPAAAAVGAIGAKLTAGSPYRYRWFVADRREINAFAAPGGVVVVNAGLLRAVDSPEELAGVIAHEVAHAELRHGLRIVVKSLGLRALASIVLGDASGSILADAATRLTELRYSREAEREADRDGMRRLVAARIDPQGMVSFYRKLQAEGKAAPPPLLSTHPATGERLEWLVREVASRKERWEPLAVDLPRAKESVR